MPVPRHVLDHSESESPKQTTWSTLLWQRLVVSVLVSGTAKIQALSQPASLRLGQRLGDFAFRAAANKQKVAEANLRLAFGNEKSSAEREAIVRGVFRHFGQSLVAFLRAPMCTDEELALQVTVEGWEHVEKARQDGKGIIITTGHIGNWEMLARWLPQVQKLKLAVVAKDPKGAALADYMRKMRQNAGYVVLSKGESARPLLRVLQRGEVIFILPDQNSGDVFVPFFGLPTGTAAGPASLALHTGATLVPVFCLTKPDGTFHVVCQPPISTISTGDRESDVSRIMTEFNAVLEAMIRQYPDQWLWLHSRWRSVFEEKNRARAWEGREAERDASLARWQGKGG